MKDDHAQRVRNLLPKVLFTLTTISFFLLLAEPLSRSNLFFGPIVSARNVVSETISDPQLQWLVVLLLLVLYLLSALPDILRDKRVPTLVGPKSIARSASFSATSAYQGAISYTAHCILAFVLIITAAYFCRYQLDSSSDNVIVLLASINVGALASLWVKGFRSPQKWTEGGPVPSLKCGIETWAEMFRLRVNRLKIFVVIIPVLLAVLTIASGDESRFTYLGQVRWVGIWYNPNLYGSLMASGLILSIGYVAFDTPRTVIGQLIRVLCALSGCLCFLGLVFSYSRGAWLGSLLGLSFVGCAKVMLDIVVLSHNKQDSEFSRQVIKLAPYIVLAVVSLAVIGFWHFRFTEIPLVRRIFSIANPFDFSWRNRVYTWFGAFEMIVARPFTGFGWVASERIFHANYNHWELLDTSAYRLNDFLCLAASYGLPTVSLLMVSILLAIQSQCVDIVNALKAVCVYNHCSFKLIPSPGIGIVETGIVDIKGAADGIGIACTIVGALIHLAATFWFEGCLFIVPTAVLFWLLIFLIQDFPLRLVSFRAASDAGQTVARTGASWAFSRYWRVFCLCVAGYAVSLTILQLCFRYLAVNPTTLKAGEYFCVPSESLASYRRLGASTDWQVRRVGDLIDTVRVADYNRKLAQWRISDDLYYEYVLGDNRGDGMTLLSPSRLALWFFFYPKVKGQASISDAVSIVKEYLSENAGREKALALFHGTKAQVRLVEGGLGGGIEVLAVAILRAVGIPSRLDMDELAEFHDSSGWRHVF